MGVGSWDNRVCFNHILVQKNVSLSSMPILQEQWIYFARAQILIFAGQPAFQTVVSESFVKTNGFPSEE